MRRKRAGPGWILAPLVRWCLEFAAAQIDAVRAELGPRVSGIARLVVIAVALATPVFLAVSSVRVVSAPVEWHRAEHRPALEGSNSPPEFHGHDSSVGGIMGLDGIPWRKSKKKSSVIESAPPPQESVPMCPRRFAI